MDNLDTKTLISKLFLPAAVISTIGYGGYTYQNAKNTQESHFEPKVVALTDLDFGHNSTSEFSKLLSESITYSNEMSS